MGTLGYGQPLLSTNPPPPNPQTRTHAQTHTTHPSSLRQLFFLELLQSHAVASFTATICPRAAHTPCETFKVVTLNVYIDCISLNFCLHLCYVLIKICVSEITCQTNRVSSLCHFLGIFVSKKFEFLNVLSE